MSIDVTTYSVLNSYTLFMKHNLSIEGGTTVTVNDGDYYTVTTSGLGTINGTKDTVNKDSAQTELNTFVSNINAYCSTRTATSIGSTNTTLVPGVFDANITIPADTTITYTLNDASDPGQPFIIRCNTLQGPFADTGVLNFVYSPNISPKNIILLVKDSNYAVVNFSSFKGVIIIPEDYSASAPALIFSSMNGKIYSNCELFSYKTLTISDSLHCFAENTKILTPKGYVNVEDLSVGDLVLTEGRIENNRNLTDAANEVKKIVWCGNTSCVIEDRYRAPVRFQAGALGPQVPTEDLYLSPNHGVIVEGTLVPSYKLINGTTIDHDFTRKKIRYYHFRLESHMVVTAQGVPCESCLKPDSETEVSSVPKRPLNE
jgi:hypothetical protein